MLEGKHILLGVTGSIAAYKAAVLTRLLVKRGAEVKVVMTPLAKQFITPLTMATLSRNPILVEFFNPENGEWNSHVSLGQWADVFLVAPATANTLAKMAAGVADNLLLTTYLSAKCDVFVAPAMDLDMYAHSTTQANLKSLRGAGVHVIEPASGELASGLDGKGRMAEPEDIADSLELFFSKGGPLAGTSFVVTAGPTVESIDPVRFISNHSTGTMGYSIAAVLASRGAAVTLVSGRTSLPTPAGVKRVDVLSAGQMYEKTLEAFEAADGAVMCAAVADYTPLQVSDTKLKKSDDDMCIRLCRTRDIAASLGQRKNGRILVGFALESDHEQENATEKLVRKNFDFIVLNSLRDKGACFGTGTNKISFIDGSGRRDFPLEDKRQAACRIVDEIERIRKTVNNKHWSCCHDSSSVG